MKTETTISLLSGLLTRDSHDVVQCSLNKIILPTVPDSITISAILKIIQSDKKSENGNIHWTLLADIGRGIINRYVSTDIVIQALKQTKGIRL
jgi:3-dehydroquinate synthetase